MYECCLWVRHMRHLALDLVCLQRCVFKVKFKNSSSPWVGWQAERGGGGGESRKLAVAMQAIASLPG